MKEFDCFKQEIRFEVVKTLKHNKREVFPVRSLQISKKLLDYFRTRFGLTGRWNVVPEFYSKLELTSKRFFSENEYSAFEDSTFEVRIQNNLDICFRDENFTENYISSNMGTFKFRFCRHDLVMD